MNWTFGIITSPQSNQYINQIIDSIEQQNIPDDQYEIIVVGADPVDRKNTKHIAFDEQARPGWITRKKNLVAQNAKFECLSIGHDYVAYQSNWYQEFEKFGSFWDIAMCRQENIQGIRYRDWMQYEPSIQFLPYDVSNKTQNMYVSGTYFAVKKDWLLRYPMNEGLGHSEAEDIEWSGRMRFEWNYRMNPHSVVRFLKEKPCWPKSPEDKS